jgi:hypothetical protein
VDILLTVLDPREAPFWLAALMGLWRIGMRPPRRELWIWVCSVLAITNIALYWLLIPYRTQQRFMLQAIGLAVVPLAVLLDRSLILRAFGVVALAVHVTTPQSWPCFERPPWDASPLIPSNVSAILDLSSQDVRVVAVFLCLGLGSAWTWARVLKRRSMWNGIGATLASVMLFGAGAGLAILDPATRGGAAFFPPSFPDYYRGWHELDLRSGPQGTTVAYAGTNLPFYLMGTGLRNGVRYVNIDEHRNWLLHDYHRAAVLRSQPNWQTPRPGWDRVRPNYDAWLGNLHAQGVQILVVCRANPVEGLQNIADSENFPIERQWAESHPESFAPLFGVRESDPQFRIYRVLPARGRPPERGMPEGAGYSTENR